MYQHHNRQGADLVFEAFKRVPLIKWPTWGHVTVWIIYICIFMRFIANKHGRLLTLGRKFSTQTLKSSSTSCSYMMKMSFRHYLTSQFKRIFNHNIIKYSKREYNTQLHYLFHPSEIVRFFFWNKKQVHMIKNPIDIIHYSTLFADVTFLLFFSFELMYTSIDLIKQD